MKQQTARQDFDIPGERWRGVKGFPMYSISDHGRVYSSIRRGRFLKPGTQSNSGHKFVCLRRDNKTYNQRVHVLVAVAFIGPCPEGKEVDHKDFDATNNHYKNLQYLTHLENVARSRRAGRMSTPPHLRGEQIGSSKLTKVGVFNMRVLYKQGWSQTKLAKAFGVNQSTVSAVLRKATWAHV